MKKVIIFSDGACSGNPGPGGWAAIMKYGNIEKEIFGAENGTTNNRMEMLAAIKALESLKEECYVDLYTDSVYLKDGITKWIHSWKINNWKSSSKKPVKNVDLWEKLDMLANKHKITWHWIKGHSDNEYNNRVDVLAVKAREMLVSK